MTTEQALQIIAESSNSISIVKDIMLPIITTLIGALMGGLVALVINRKFEKERLRISLEMDFNREVYQCLFKGFSSVTAIYTHTFIQKNIEELKKHVAEISELQVEALTIQGRYGIKNDLTEQVKSILEKLLEVCMEVIEWKQIQW